MRHKLRISVKWPNKWINKIASFCAMQSHIGYMLGFMGELTPTTMRIILLSLKIKFLAGRLLPLSLAIFTITVDMKRRIVDRKLLLAVAEHFSIRLMVKMCPSFLADTS